MGYNGLAWSMRITFRHGLASIPSASRVSSAAVKTDLLDLVHAGMVWVGNVLTCAQKNNVGTFFRR